MLKCYAWLDSEGVVRGDLRIDDSIADEATKDLPVHFIGTDVSVVADMVNKKQWNPETSLMEDWEPPVRVISKFQFLKRFSAEKRAALLTLAKTDVMVEVFMTMLNAAQEVDLDDQETVQGIEYLVSVNAITEEERDAILA